MIRNHTEGTLTRPGKTHSDELHSLLAPAIAISASIMPGEPHREVVTIATASARAQNALKALQAANDLMLPVRAGRLQPVIAVPPPPKGTPGSLVFHSPSTNFYRTLARAHSSAKLQAHRII